MQGGAHRVCHTCSGACATPVERLCKEHPGSDSQEVRLTGLEAARTTFFFVASPGIQQQPNACLPSNGTPGVSLCGDPIRLELMIGVRGGGQN